MYQHGVALGIEGYTLRSGYAKGADQAFERGSDRVNGKKEIFLPWKGFEGHASELFHIPEEAYKLGGEIYGSRWDSLKPSYRKFLARDILQVVGMDMNTPSDFVMCWTPDGCETKADRKRETGGTGQAIALASELGIPVFNMFNGEDAFFKYKASI
jgi:hypothetical protein